MYRLLSSGRTQKCRYVAVTPGEEVVAQSFEPPGGIPCPLTFLLPSGEKVFFVPNRAGRGGGSLIDEKGRTLVRPTPKRLRSVIKHGSVMSLGFSPPNKRVSYKCKF